METTKGPTVSKLVITTFFLEYEGELCIFVLRRRNNPITKHHTPPWTRMGMMDKSLKEKNYYKLKIKRDLSLNQDSKTLRTCSEPQLPFILKFLECALQIGSRPIKNTGVPMLPEDPCSKNN